MDPLTSSAASGLRSRMESLDMLANNLANTETGGYKSDREFYGLYLAQEAADNDTPVTMPVIERAWTDFSQGILRPTGSPYDFALSGKGFFAIEGPGGPLYTRQGAFRISPEGALVTAEGYPVRLTNRRPLQAQTSVPVDVSADGTIKQQGQVLGKLDVVTFPDTAVLAKRGNNYFQITDPNATPVAASDTTIHQGNLESSNVRTAESAVRLVTVMRQFEMLHKAISIGEDMNKRAVEEVARVGS